MTTLTVWAPAASQAEVEVAGQRYPMRRDDVGTPTGWWSADVPDVTAGIDYGSRYGRVPASKPAGARQ